MGRSYSFMAVIGGSICLFVLIDHIPRRTIIIAGLIGTTICHGLIVASSVLLPEGPLQAYAILGFVALLVLVIQITLNGRGRRARRCTRAPGVRPARIRCSPRHNSRYSALTYGAATYGGIDQGVRRDRATNGPMPDDPRGTVVDGVDVAEWLYAIVADLACTDRELDAAFALLSEDDPTPRREIGIGWLEQLGYLIPESAGPVVIDRGDGWRERVRTWKLRIPGVPHAVGE